MSEKQKNNHTNNDVLNSGVIRVDLLFNTGFNPSNFPANWEVVAQDSYSTDAIWLLQDKIQPIIKVNESFDDIKNADYCYFTTISDSGITAKTFYIINNIIAINKNNTMLHLQLDPICTIGLENIDIIAGWAIRAHPLQDELFLNVIPESFSPIYPTQLKHEVVNFGDEYVDLIASTVDLVNLNPRLEKIYSAQATNYEFFKIVNEAQKFTKVYFPSRQNAERHQKTMKFTTLFELKDVPPSTFQLLQGLGLLNSIIASYRVPKRFIHRIEKDAANRIIEIVGDGVGFNVNLPFVYNQNTNIKYKKVFSILNNYTISSVTNGSQSSFTAYEINNKQQQPSFILQPDVSPNGNAFLFPDFYKGQNRDDASNFAVAINGNNWQNNPLLSLNSSGYLFNNALSNIAAKQAGTNISFLNRKSGLMEEMLANTQVGINSSYSTKIGETERNLDVTDKTKYASLLNTASSNIKNPALYIGLAADVGLGIYDKVQGNDSNRPVFSPLAAQNLTTQYNMLNMQANASNLSTLQNVTLEKGQLDLLNTQQGIENAINNTIFHNQREQINFTRATYSTPPTINFQISDNLQYFFDNTFVITQEVLDERDLIRFNDYFSRFGYSVSEPLTNEHLNSYTHFNYVQGNGLIIKDKSKIIPKYIIDMLIRLLEVGVRVWHQPITKDAFLHNAKR